MCGIAGIYRPGGIPDGPSAGRLLREAAEAMAHRGPDAEGLVVDAAAGVAFAHRRLAILDLDPRSNQPMASADASALITFNGEIYNYRELKAELAAGGARFRTESDTEVLLEGTRAWGLEGLLARAAGMFAFALFDRREKSLFLVRDRAGKKPLFYRADAGGLAFASELRGLLRLRPEARELDPAGLDAYLALKFVPSPGTLLAGVRKVPPGHFLALRPGREPELKRYWHPLGAPPASERGLAERIEEALETAVRRRLVSDVPVCLFLSGGVDSGLIAAELGKAGGSGMTAYSIGYRDLPRYNEFEHARSVAEACGLRYEEVVLESSEALRMLAEDSPSLDEPLSDWIWVPLYQLSQRARAGGFKVALLGEGSDEIFFGYDAMLQGLRQTRRWSAGAWRGLAKAGTALLAPVYRRARRGHGRYDLARRVAEGAPIYMGTSVGFGKSQRHQVAGPRLAEAGDPDAGEAFIRRLGGEYDVLAGERADEANRICYVEFYSKMGEVLLTRVDRVSMLCSLEARAPFLDYDLVELAFSIPERLKLPGGRLKGALKDLARRRLPPAAVDRPKMGFSFPFKEWLRGELGAVVGRSFAESRLFSDGWVQGSFCRRLLAEHRSGLVDHAPRIWMMFSLARWYDRWLAP